jgi:general secretion pathway protein E
MVVRFRVDGRMSEFMQQPMTRFQAIASRIKLLSELDIAERRLPQDGRFSIRAGSKDFDVRVSTAPDVHGESIVMRLLPKKRDELSLQGLGFENDHLELIREWGALSNGIVLVTGPTGSGKSTTLYGLLADIKTGQEKIVTVEDPVEYQLEGITQVQAHPEIGYTFAKALRTFLRQDPDVIMVGEIRDKETADIAVQSSLTGHLVLSTLHTNDACSVFPRLADIGVEPYLVAATIQGVQAQRLLRKLCAHCCEPAEAPSFINTNLQGDWRKPVGCQQCQGRGYRGRVGVYELISVDSKMRELITQRAPVTKIRALARTMGHRSLLEDGLLKASKGVTSVEEVLRVCSVEESDT